MLNVARNRWHDRLNEGDSEKILKTAARRSQGAAISDSDGASPTSSTAVRVLDLLHSVLGAHQHDRDACHNTQLVAYQAKDSQQVLLLAQAIGLGAREPGSY